MTRMKYIFNFIMMIIAYNGFAQNAQKEKAKNTVTFSNGDEAIRIITKADRNVIKLSNAAAYDEYENLDLSHHEAMHKSAARRKLREAEQGESYMVDRSAKETEDENEESSGA